MAKSIETQLSEAQVEIMRQRIARFRLWNQLENVGRQYFEATKRPTRRECIVSRIYVLACKVMYVLTMGTGF